MPPIPRDRSFDSTLALLSEGYPFISDRCRRYQTDLFETRLMLRKAVCATGPEAAEMFYHPGRFTRRAAMPPTTLRLLQDKGSVQTLDGTAHRHRKQMFLSVMTPAQIQALADLVAEAWRDRLAGWTRQEEVVLHDEVQAILCRAVCRWAGVPLSDAEAAPRTREFAAMIDGAGAVGPRNWKGLLLRRRTERWARGRIHAIRDHRLDVPEGSAAHATAWHRAPDGTLLDARVAAVELINFLRPTVAVARYITFAALALHTHPECRRPLQSGPDDYPTWFVHEVRRCYPFFPLIAGRARQPFDWHGHPFDRGAWVLLDLYGTNRDARTWTEPDAFRPERFSDWDGSAFNFIPQGGGDHAQAHRCAGEWLTIALMQTAVHLLASEMHYAVPEQDLHIDLSRMPALPASRFVIGQVRHA